MKILAFALSSFFCFFAVAGCGGGSTSTTGAPPANEYEAYIAEHPEAAEVMSEELDSGVDQ